MCFRMTKKHSSTQTETPTQTQTQAQTTHTSPAATSKPTASASAKDRKLGVPEAMTSYYKEHDTPQTALLMDLMSKTHGMSTEEVTAYLATKRPQVDGAEIMRSGGVGDGTSRGGYLYSTGGFMGSM